jgi:hypothetical protein
VIVPSENLVVVRFGVSHISGGDIKGTGALAHDVIAVLHAGAASRWCVASEPVHGEFQILEHYGLGIRPGL